MYETPLSRFELGRIELCNWLNSLDNVTSREEAEFHARIGKINKAQRAWRDNQLFQGKVITDNEQVSR